MRSYGIQRKQKWIGNELDWVRLILLSMYSHMRLFISRSIIRVSLTNHRGLAKVLMISIAWQKLQQKLCWCQTRLDPICQPIILTCHLVSKNVKSHMEFAAQLKNIIHKKWLEIDPLNPKTIKCCELIIFISKTVFFITYFSSKSMPYA